ncbi:MAG TPA: PadR family transcriptional regulator [Streptosporangiaceae bacterium]|nr:PadR family transcriptional regulator [Streptosporangiaceae bacterium]
MPPRVSFSTQTLAVLSALAVEPSSWRHGYDLAKETSLKSGTLYPILVRLADRGLVEACWEDEQPAGRPRRHLYRLTSDGLAVSVDALAAADAKRRAAAAGPRSAPAPRLAGESS